MKRGRPLFFETKVELEAKIEEYFLKCESKPMLTPEGDAILDKNGYPAYYPEKPPTIAGLAYHLGFASRQSLLDYKGRKEFSDTITRAKLYIEAYTEGRLFDREGAGGAKFSLMNNFKNWKERSESENSNTDTVRVIDDV